MSELDRLQEVKNGLKKEIEKLIADLETHETISNNQPCWLRKV